MPVVISLPEIGQIVKVRERHYHVIDIAESTLPPDISRALSSSRHHLVALACVEDDGLGEELRVIWEIEPGAEAKEAKRLPAGHEADAPGVFDAFLDAVRWGAISANDRHRLQSPFRSGIAIEPYQLEPLSRAISMPRVNLLIADDVGLGKTIEAGLVALELMLRHRAHRMLIVCPATLTVQWQEQMMEKFGLSFQIMNRDYIAAQRRSRGIHLNPWLSHPRLIVSIDFLKQTRVRTRLMETFPADPYPRPIDLLIVDEAANVAPSGRGKYARETDRTRVIREISPHCEHRLFLTATPHNGYRESFTALLELVDDQRFARGVSWDPKQLEATMIRRMKRDIVDPHLGTPRFKEREVRSIEVAYTDQERELHRLLKEYAASRQKMVEGDARRELLLNFVLTLLKKRLFSSPEAFASTIERHLESVDGQKRAGKIEPRADILRERLLRLDRDVPEGEEYDDDLSASIDDARHALPELSHQQRQLLEKLRSEAEKRRHKTDAKAERLLDWLKREIKPGGVWSDRRVIIFTEYRDTLNYLHGLLATHGYRDDRVEVLDGSTDDEKREWIKKQFQADPRKTPVRILLATDAVSEGLDLQLHCSRLIHYEIPWNPNRLEQRNGRIDRHGQKETPTVYHFAPASFQQMQLGEKRSGLDDDLEFLALAVQKVQAIRADLGSFGEVIAEQVSRKMLGESVTLDVERDPERQERARAASAAMSLTQNVRAEIERLDRQVRETEQLLHLEPEHVERAVATALRLFHQPPLQPVRLSGDVTAYLPGQMTEGWASTTRGMEDPLTGELRPLVFDRRDARDRDDVVLAHLQHPLVARSLALLRAEIWSGQEGVLNRVTVRLADDRHLSNIVMLAHGRIVIAGADGARLHEEIITAGGNLQSGRWSRRNVGDTELAMQASLDDAAPELVVRQLLDRWEDDRPVAEGFLNQRLNEVQNGMRRDLDLQREREKRDIRDRLNELAAQIDKQLKDVEATRQLTLFGDEEDRSALHHDLEAIKARRQRIPADIEQEIAALERRYETRTPHLFPVAVEFLVPRGIARDLEGRR